MIRETVYPSRQAAITAGGRLYQGSPCKRGHVSGVRYVVNKGCCECAVEDAFWRQRDADAERRRKREAYRAGRWVREDAAKKRARGARYRAEMAQRPEAIEKRHARALAVQERAAAKEAELLDLARRREEERARRSTPEYAAEMRERHLHRDRMKAKRRRAVTRGASATAKEADVLDIFASQGGRCAYCGKVEDLHLDHKWAVVRGGPHAAWNLQFLCAGHNMAKKDRHDAEYRRANGIPHVTPWDGWRTRLLWVAFAV